MSLLGSSRRTTQLPVACNPLLPLEQEQIAVLFLHGHVSHVRVVRHLRYLLPRRSVERLERVVAMILDRCGVVFEGDAPETVVDRANLSRCRQDAPYCASNHKVRSRMMGMSS